MQIVIDIPKGRYEDILSGKEFTIYQCDIREVLKSGTPLPEGHGRIVDIGKIDDDRIESDNPVISLTINGEYIEAVSLDYLYDLPVIIEADNEDKQE